MTTEPAPDKPPRSPTGHTPVTDGHLSEDRVSDDPVTDREGWGWPERQRRRLLGALGLSVAATALGVALNSPALVIPTVLVAAITVVAYDKSK